MAEFTTYLALKTSYVIDETAPSSTLFPKTSGNITYADVSSAEGSRRRLWAEFNALADQYKFNKLIFAQVNIPKLDSAAWISCSVPTTTPGAGRTWNDAAALTKDLLGYSYGDQLFLTPTEKNGALSAADLSLAGKKMLKAGNCFLYPGSDNVARRLYTHYYNIEQMRLHVRIDSAVTITSQVTGSGKTSGYVNPHQAQSFAWAFGPSGEYYCAGDWSQASATFYWRAGTSGSWTTVAASGSTQAVTIPAETMPVGTVQWYVQATDDQGTTTSSPVYTITTEDSLQVATPLSPIGTVEDGSAEILMTWQEANDTGTTPTGADLQISTNGTTWTDLAHVTGAATQYTAPAGSFVGGTVYWRVRAYNIDNAAGPWSEAAAFVSVAAPPAPIVTAEAVPFATIRWQSDGQQAWRVTVDGTVFGPYFGTGKSFTLRDYLQDGEHTAQVEVQGSFGLWSQAGQVSFTVANVPGDVIQLSGVFYRDAALSWETESQTADFLIYRDGVRIGHTNGSSFTDRVILGRHRWQVINRLPGGTYTASNVVEGELKSCGLAVALLAGGEWLELTKSASSTREIGTTISQAASVRHFAGEIWPSAEVAPYRDQAVSFDAAWLQREKSQAAAFEAAIGQTVILKVPDGSCVVGLLSAVSRRSQIFFRAYTATVTRVKWRDYVDEDR